MNYLKSKKFTFLLLGSTLICFALLILLRCKNVSQGIDYGVDVYYHIKAGDLFPFFATTKTFPWAEMSIWKISFYDKELGFHFIIFILRKLSVLLGISSQAPFNFISCCLSGLLLLLFSLWGYFKCRGKAFILAPLLVFLSPLFMQKLIIIRPAIVSIALFSLTVFIMISEMKFKFKLLLVFITGWLYALFYSVPHIVLIPLIIYAVSALLTKDTKENIKFILLPCAGIVGIIIGLTVHPQFPNTYINWYIQGFQVVAKMFGTTVNGVELGSGMQSPASFEIKQNILIFILLFINTAMFWAAKKNQRNKFLFLLQLITVIGFLFSKRFIEYAVPSEIICFAVLVSTHRESEEHFILSFYSNFITLIVGCVILTLTMLPIENRIIKTMQPIPPCYKFGKWQKNNIPKGAYIGLLNWGDFPRLFYTAPELKYSMALDPMFSYYVYPERTNAIEQFRLGYDQEMTPSKLAKLYGTNLLYVPKFYHILVMFLIEQGAKVTYYDEEGCLLRLTSSKNKNIETINF